MATTVTTSAKTLSASALAAATTHIALLNSSNAEPANAGYARQSSVWAAAAGGAVSLSGTYAFTVSGFTVAKVAGYTAVSGGTQYLVDDVTPVEYTADGTYTVASGTLTFGDPA